MLNNFITSVALETKLEASSTGFKYINNRRISGYEPEAALGELIDNPMDPNVDANEVHMHFHLEKNPRGVMEVNSIYVIDDGKGMSESELENCHRLGSSRNYQKTDLGRFGEGGIMGSLSLCAHRETFSRDTSGILRVRCYDMDLVEAEDTWGSYTRLPTQDEVNWFNSLIGENKTGTIIRLSKLDLIRPKTWEYLKKRLESYLPKTYDNWLSSNSSRQIKLKAFHLNKEVYDWKVPTYDPLHWDQKFTLNAARQEVFIPHATGKIRVRTVYLGEEHGKNKSALMNDQGGYLYRNGRLIACGEKLQTMLRGSYRFHNDYRRMRYSIHYEADLDVSMGTRPSKDGINPEQSINDKILRPIHNCKSWTMKHIRAKKSQDNHQATSDILPDIADMLSAAHSIPNEDKATSTKNKTEAKPSSNLVNLGKKIPKLKKKQYGLELVENGRMGVFGDCSLSDKPDTKYQCDFNIDHPMISYLMAKDEETKTLILSILAAQLACMSSFEGISSLSDGEKSILKDKYQRSLDDTLRNLISIST
jgi:hypothetical protein